MIRLDLNNPEFQANLLELNKQEAWELIQSRQGPSGERLYSMRSTRSCRAVAWRDGDWLRLLSLHPDHDSA